MNEIIHMREYENSNKGVIGNTQVLVEIAKKDASNFEVIKIARRVCEDAGCNNFSPESKADAIFHFVKNNIKWQADPVGGVDELYQETLVTLREGIGDCDDFVIVGLSLNFAIGNMARATLVAANNKEYIDHIYYEVEIGNGNWKAYDPSYPKSYAGWKPDREFLKYYVSFEGAITTMGFFDDLLDSIFDFFHKFEKHVIRKPLQEIKRFTKANFPIIYEAVSAFFRVIRDLKRAAFEALAKILDDIAVSLPVIGGLVKTLIKAAITLVLSAVVGAFLSTILRIQPPLDGLGFQTITIKPLVVEQITFFSLTTDEKSPLLMSSEEWATLLSIALTVASFGAAAMGSLAAVTALEVTATAQGIIDTVQTLKAKREALAQMKAIKAQVLIHRQAQLEIILKLEHDIEILELLTALQSDLAEDFFNFQEDRKGEIAIFESQELQKAKERIVAYEKELGTRKEAIVNFARGLA